MKRSEVIEILSFAIMNSVFSLEWDTDKVANELLTTLENRGMLPPAECAPPCICQEYHKWEE